MIMTLRDGGPSGLFIDEFRSSGRNADGDQHFGVVDPASPFRPLVMAAAIVALGLLSFNKLPITRMPNVDVPRHLGHDHTVRARPRPSWIAGHQDGRGRRLGRGTAPTTSTRRSPTGCREHDHHVPAGNRTPIARSTTSRTR